MPLARFLRYSYMNIPNSRFCMKRTLSKSRRPKLEDKEILQNILTGTTINSPNDVDHLRSQVLDGTQRFSAKNVDSKILNYFASNKQYQAGLNFIKYLDSEKKTSLNLFLTNMTFRMYFLKRFADRSLSKEEEDHLISLYENQRKRYPVLNSTSLEAAILALSVTKNWKECLIILDEIRKTDKPSGTCYSAIVAAAFLNNEEKLAWTILENMFEDEKSPCDVTFSAYIEKLQDSAVEDILIKMEKLFLLCRTKDLIFSEDVIVELHNMLKNKGISSKLSSVDRKGYCRCCHKKLEALEITDDKFVQLKEKIETKVIHGKNIFSKTTPEEFSRFQDFLKTITNSNVVIDGLNVAYTAGTRQPMSVYSSLLAHVVSHFVQKGRNVVVLGRAHMNNWPKPTWNYILKNAKVFLTQNISEDDPYLLCCALHCGKDSIIVSRDLMRSHLFLLKEPNDKILFSRWLTQRQYQVNFVTNDGIVHFKLPLPFTRTMQKDDDCWHIPYNPAIDEADTKNEIPNTWLCIKHSK